MDNVKPCLLIIDALVDVTGGADENDAASMQPIMHFLCELAETRQCAVVVVHHSTKTGSSYRGSSAIAGAADLMLAIESKPDSGEVTFRSDKARDVEPFAFTSTATWIDADDPDIATFRLVKAVGANKKRRLTPSEEYVVNYLTQHGPSLLTEIQAHADTCSGEAARLATYRLAKPDRKITRRCDGGGPGIAAKYELVKDEDPWDAAMKT